MIFSFCLNKNNVYTKTNNKDIKKIIETNWISMGQAAKLNIVVLLVVSSPSILGSKLACLGRV
jgi:hypothetical protein